MAVTFTQNGTVDWTSLTSMTISTPITIMSRLAQSGVDQYTIELVKFYGQFLNLPSDYLGTVEAGLIKARKFGLSAGVLYVGTGISLIPSLLAKTRGGVAFAAVIMALRASFPANFTARVLSEWLRFFERPPEISIPSISQLQALSNEVAACPIDPEIGRIIWGIEGLHKGAFRTHSPSTAPPPAQDLAAAIYAITTIRPGQDAIIRFKSRHGPSPVWLAAFASKVVGLGVSYEVDTQVVWEQPQKYCAISGARGRLRLVTGVSSNRGSHTENYQLLKSACIKLDLQRREPNIQTSFRISPKLVVDKILMSFFDDPGQQDEAIRCIGKAAYHLSRKPAVWLAPTASVVQYQFTRNGTRAALLMIGANPDELDVWEAEAEARGSTHSSRSGREAHIFEARLQDLFGMPFVLLFKKIHVVNQQSFPGDQEYSSVYLPPWSRSCLDTFKSVLALWTVLAFASPIDQTSISLDWRVVYRVIERSNGMSAAFNHMWREISYYLEGPKIGFETSVTNNLDPEVLESHLLQILTVQEMAFDIFGSDLDANHPPNTGVAGIANGGAFIVMSTLLEPNRQGPKDAAIIFVGQGRIFVNQQATTVLQSLDANKALSSFNISPELQNLSCIQYMHSYTTEAESFSDLTQTNLDMSLYVSGGPEIVSLAWSVSGRSGSDILVDVLLSPHRILRGILAIQSIDKLGKLHEVSLSDGWLGLPEVHGQKDIYAINLESFLTKKHDRNQLIITKKNPLAQLLAIAYWLYNTQRIHSIRAEYAARLVYLCPSEQLRIFLPRMPENSTVIVS